MILSYKNIESKHKNNTYKRASVPQKIHDCDCAWGGKRAASTLNMHSLLDIMHLDALRAGYEIYLVAGILWSFPNMVLVVW